MLGVFVWITTCVVSEKSCSEVYGGRGRYVKIIACEKFYSGVNRYVS